MAAIQPIEATIETTPILADILAGGAVINVGGGGKSRSIFPGAYTVSLTDGNYISPLGYTSLIFTSSDPLDPRVIVVATEPLTLSKLQITGDIAPGDGNSIGLRVIKNEDATDIECVITDDEIHAVDDAHSVSIDTGESFTFQIINPDGTAATSVLNFTLGIQFLGSEDNVGIVATDDTLTGDGSSENPLGIAQQGATNGQVLQWNGLTWVPVTISGSGIVQSIVAGPNISVDNTDPANPIVKATPGGNTYQIQYYGLDGTIAGSPRVILGNDENAFLQLTTFLADDLPIRERILFKTSGGTSGATLRILDEDKLAELSIKGQNQNATASFSEYSPIVVIANSDWSGLCQGYNIEFHAVPAAPTAAVDNTVLVLYGNKDLGINGVRYTWPSADGSNGYILSTNGAGDLAWIPAPSGGIASVVAGTGITVDNTDPDNPIVNAVNNGTVTDVTASSPLASTGGATPDISLSGTVPIANGGTGETTANDALNALLPDQTGHSGEALVSGGADASWQAITAGIAIGDAISGANNNRVLFTDASGNLSQDTTFLFDPSTKLLQARKAEFDDVVNGNNTLSVNTSTNGASNVQAATFSSNISSNGDATSVFINTTGSVPSSGAIRGLYIQNVQSGTGPSYAAVFNGGTVGIGDLAPKSALSVQSGGIATKLTVNNGGNILPADSITLVNSLLGAINLNLFGAGIVSAGHRITIKDGTGNCSAINTITINANGADTIDGAATAVLSTAFASIVLFSDGSGAWYIEL